MTKVNDKEYSVENQGFALPTLRADLIRRGFDGNTYILTGKRNAQKLAYRLISTGSYVIV